MWVVLFVCGGEYVEDTESLGAERAMGVESEGKEVSAAVTRDSVVLAVLALLPRLDRRSGVHAHIHHPVACECRVIGREQSGCHRHRASGPQPSPPHPRAARRWRAATRSGRAASSRRAGAVAGMSGSGRGKRRVAPGRACRCWGGSQWVACRSGGEERASSLSC